MHLGHFEQLLPSPLAIQHTSSESYDSGISATFIVFSTLEYSPPIDNMSTASVETDDKVIGLMWAISVDALMNTSLLS